ncbi:MULTISPECIES: hypothetical protein [Oceanimonas]|uniref:hypothetical protein n=1 Tax=Oceanimonas TaxID=129577 RepID=UPI0013F62D8E|nr:MULTISPECIES: hypothetical protein [Oceanimonas]
MITLLMQAVGFRLFSITVTWAGHAGSGTANALAWVALKPMTNKNERSFIGGVSV